MADDVFVTETKEVTNNDIYKLVKATHDQAKKTNGRVDKIETCLYGGENKAKYPGVVYDVKKLKKNNIIMYIKKNKILLGIISALLIGGGGTAVYKIPFKKIIEVILASV